MGRYDKMSQEDFDRILADKINEFASKAQNGAADLLSFPGVYEVLSEEFNNEVLDAWEQEQADKAEDEQLTGANGERGVCPVCGETVTIIGKTTDGRIFATCGDAFTVEQWTEED